MQKLSSVVITGIQGYEIDVEVDVTPGMGQFTVVGLGDTAIQESRERVRSAIKNSGYKFPGGARITANLAPADIKKKGPIYDLPIALGILAKECDFQEEIFSDAIFLGELALDGHVRGVNGVLPAAILTREQGKKYLFLPLANAPEASVIPDITLVPIETLRDAIDILEGRRSLEDFVVNIPVLAERAPSWGEVDFSYIHGQEQAKRALVIAAAGGHNLLMQGPPGSGKTMLAKALAGILPPLDLSEQIEISKIYSVAGLLSTAEPLITARPFRTIHHTASEASIIGGGRDARPGEISLAHKGILFLDEFLEFSKNLIETLRQPMEDGYITVNRVNHSSRYPARFSLIGAMNPCPCGYLGDPEKPCVCSAGAIEKYRSRLSGPILDRIDIFLTVPRIRINEIQKIPDNTPSKVYREKVIRAHTLQQERFRDESIHSNAEMSNKHIEFLARIHDDALQITLKSVEKLHLSSRAYYRILRVARTIADIEGSEEVLVPHVLEALSYRGTHS